MTNNRISTQDIAEDHTVVTGYKTEMHNKTRKTIIYDLLPGNITTRLVIASSWLVETPETVLRYAYFLTIQKFYMCALLYTCTLGIPVKTRLLHCHSHDSTVERRLMERHQKHVLLILIIIIIITSDYMVKHLCLERGASASPGLLLVRTHSRSLMSQ